MKKCRKCQEWKDEGEFPWRNKLLKTRQTICKTCTAEQSRQWYKGNRARQIRSVRARKEQARQAAREFIWDYLSYKVCVDCGEYDPMLLEFDHVRGKKKLTISQMVRDGYSIDAIQKEISKCEVVCSNCHTRREKKRRGTKYW